MAFAVLRLMTSPPWFVNEGTIALRLNYSKGNFEMTQARSLTV
jgi:hypothetical protein